MISIDQKNKIEANIKHLDYLEGTGILNSNRKSLVNEFFIFIGAGGTGIKALIKLKKTLKRQVEFSEIAKKTMFLGVDTAWKEADLYVKSGDLLPGEVIKIPYVGAHESINPDKILPQTKKWVHKDLWAETGGAAADVTPPPEMSGDGAGGKRQCGRVLFVQSAAQDELYRHLETIRKKLSNMGACKIKVFFLAGIAGGTGSGTIVDLAYLCRHHLKNILATAYNRVNFSAYLFLPSGCGTVTDPADRLSGNQNAYAALKEIDYHMTLSNRNETFQMDYGTDSVGEVEIVENIFDFCTLVEGVGNDGHFFENNAETARQIVADSILNVVCADIGNRVNNEDIFMADSFLSNKNEKVPGKILGNSDRVWPRDTNYIYSVIGFSSCVVPVDLLTVYVAKKIFDEVFRRFRKADLATEDRAAEFLHACGLENAQLGGVWKTLQKTQMKKDIQDQADVEFKANGPYYMVNLTKEAAKLLESDPDEYLHRARKNKNGMISNKEKWARLELLYEDAIKYLREINNSLYNVYTYTIEVLKNLVEKNAKLLTDTNEYKSTFGKTFYWSPIDLTPGDAASKAVIKYLDGILSETEVKKAAAKFMDMICDKKDEWTGLTVDSNHGTMTYNVAEEIRQFISDNLQKCISTTMEEFLVKAYSGKVDAPVWEFDDHNNQVYSEDTSDAASQILTRLNANASALAAISGMNLEHTYSNVYLTVPENCKWLYQAIVDQASAHNGIKSEFIFKSTAKDRIVLCRLYTGVPAWAFYWTKGAEEDYEKSGPHKVGIHMEQGDESRNWAELPNLYPEKLWTEKERELRKRETAISIKIKKSMQTAKDLGMLADSETDENSMDIYLLEGHYSAEELLEKAELDSAKKYTVQEVLEILADKQCLTKEKVTYINMVMKTPDKFSEKEAKEYRFDMACRIMRCLRGKWELLHNTIDVVEKLKELNESRKIIQTITLEQIVTFTNAMVWELISYDGRRGYWKNCLGDEVQMGDKLSDKLQKQCAHYYGCVAFANLEKEVFQEFQERITELEENASDEEFDKADEKKKALKESLKALRHAKKNDVKPWEEDLPFSRDGNCSEWPIATEKFVERVGDKALAEEIRKMYDNMIANI